MVFFILGKERWGLMAIQIYMNTSSRHYIFLHKIARQNVSKPITDWYYCALHDHKCFEICKIIEEVEYISRALVLKCCVGIFVSFHSGLFNSSFLSILLNTVKKKKVFRHGNTRTMAYQWIRLIFYYCCSNVN